MEDLNKRRVEIENTLNELKERKSSLEKKANAINSEIKEKIGLHNSLISSISSLKNEYKDKLQKFHLLKTLVKEYKKNQRETLEREYQAEIRRIINLLNNLTFGFKVSVFKVFDQVKSISTTNFPVLNQKKNELYDKQRTLLKKQLLSEVLNGMAGNCPLSDLIFYLNFLIKYEIYFNEDVYIDFILRNIEKEFEYHFLSNRDSNRLDKPEWIFDFLIKKYSELDSSIQIYSDCRTKNGLDRKDITQVILDCQKLVTIKISEISKIESRQKRNLVLNFASKFDEYSRKVKDKYSVEIDYESIRHVLSSTETEYIKDELQRIHELRYVQWFVEYRKLCRDTIMYINNYGMIDTEFRFKDLIRLVISHTKSFAENLRFINREEIRVILFIFNELEDLKSFILQEENEIMLTTGSSSIGITSSSIDKMTVFNAEVFKLIKRLAVGDVESILKKIHSFNYSSNEVRRTVLVEINRTIEEYGFCIYSDLINRAMYEKIDEVLFKEILVKIKFTPGEYLEFKGFFKTLKKYIQNFEWKTDEACKCIEAIFEERFEDGVMFKIFKDLYRT